ncbi:translation initiation factor IF-2 [Candidatus Woesearchaeota archaeon CG08_land_8_20_14_0_20_43_7]|nr:MAG: translation initiation factor IF-2 [Candidatus Woesearchaeota archaeon CG08_land_8_20_14_0_20_43_7]
MKCSIRSPVCACVGHVDHGKSSILDSIRGSSIVDTEAGKITQSIGASIVPLDTIKKICGKMLEAMKIDFTIPSLLFIDTPGHAAFTTLRKRGGNLADIAILVVDINEGFKPQTIEAIEILKSYKTPFIVAANKIDLLPGYRSSKTPVLANITSQDKDVLTLIEKKLYEIVGHVYDNSGMSSERFDRVNDFTKEIPIIPCSAKTGEGIPELLMMIAGLAQKYLEKGLKVDLDDYAKGTVLEVKEDKGLGKTINVILYDGSIRLGDTLVIGGIDEPLVTRVKCLFEPAPLAEMRDKKSKFTFVKQVCAAIGVKISAPDLDKAIAGMPVRTADESNIEQVKEDVQCEVKEVMIETEKDGIIIKADALGSLEALAHLLKEKNVPIRKATIGDISKKDITEAASTKDSNPLNTVILGFNINIAPDAGQNQGVKIICNDVIYKTIEDYEAWKEAEQKRLEESELHDITRPCKAQIMQGYIFRQSNPAVCGMEVLEGTLKTGMQLMKDGKVITSVKSMQHEKDSISSAEAGKKVAVSMDNVTVGRQINERDILYSGITEEEFQKLKDMKKFLSNHEKEVLKEIVDIMRKANSVWGV